MGGGFLDHQPQGWKSHQFLSECTNRKLWVMLMLGCKCLTTPYGPQQHTAQDGNMSSLALALCILCLHPADNWTGVRSIDIFSGRQYTCIPALNGMDQNRILNQFYADMTDSQCSCHIWGWVKTMYSLSWRPNSWDLWMVAFRRRVATTAPGVRTPAPAENRLAAREFRGQHERFPWNSGDFQEKF